MGGGGAAGFDFVEAKERFLLLVQAVERVVGPAGDVEVWPLVRGATFHGAVQLPPTALTPGSAASVRVSNFGNLATLHPVDDAIASPDVLAGLRLRDRAEGLPLRPHPRPPPAVPRPPRRKGADPGLADAVLRLSVTSREEELKHGGTETLRATGLPNVSAEFDQESRQDRQDAKCARKKNLVLAFLGACGVLALLRNRYGCGAARQ